jgi:hypothetical protein
MAMKTETPIRITLATLLLTLAGCDAAPVAPGPGVAETVPLHGKLENDWFLRCKPHVNVNAEEPGPTLELVAIAPDQRVDVDLGEYQAEGRFRGQLLVGADGSACGEASLEVELAYEVGGARIIVIVVGFTGATVRVEDGRRHIAFEAVAEICHERGDECETGAMTGSVGEVPVNDDPVWQFHGPGVYAPTFPARTRFATPGGEERGSVRGSFPLQEVEELEPRRSDSPPFLFEAEFEVGSAGSASGGIRVWDISDLANPQLRFTVHQGRFAASPDGVVLVWLSGILAVAVDGRVEERAFAATVRQSSVNDDPVWQFHGPGVYSKSFPASGELTLR